MVKYKNYLSQDFDIIKELEDSGALFKGHFILSSGLHSDTYLQCAQLLTDTGRAERVCAQIAQKIDLKIGADSIDIIVSPAMGGLIVGHEVARQLGKPFMFCERVDGNFTFRRGFNIDSNRNQVFVVEDVITTGKSSCETYDCVEENGGIIVGEASIVDRSGGTADLRGITPLSLFSAKIQNYTEDSLPQELSSVPVTRPGSRHLSIKKSA